MSERRKGQGRKGRRPEARPADSPWEPGRGGLAAHIAWAIVSANVLAVVALVLGAVALVLQFTEEDGEGGAAAQPTPTPPAAVSADDDPFIGPEDAAVTIIGFTDYQ